MGCTKQYEASRVGRAWGGELTLQKFAIKFLATGKSFQSNVQQFPPLQDCKLLWNIPRLDTRRMEEKYLKMEHHNSCFLMLLHDLRCGRVLQCNIGLQVGKIVA